MAEPANTASTATCACGQLSATCTGEVIRVSVCHCLDCQRRSGSAFAAQVRFRREDVGIAGEHRHWTRIAESGSAADFHFCPHCGSTVFYLAEAMPDLIAIPLGAFASRDFPEPEYSVYEGRKHPWVTVAGEGIEHYD